MAVREFYFLFWGKLFRKRRSELDMGTGKVRSPGLQCLLFRTGSLASLLFSHLQKRRAFETDSSEAMLTHNCVGG